MKYNLIQILLPLVKIKHSSRTMPYRLLLYRLINEGGGMGRTSSQHERMGMSAQKFVQPSTRDPSASVGTFLVIITAHD